MFLYAVYTSVLQRRDEMHAKLNKNRRVHKYLADRTVPCMFSEKNKKLFVLHAALVFGFIRRGQ